MPSPANVLPTDPFFDQEFPAVQSVTAPALDVFCQPDSLVALCYIIAARLELERESAPADVTSSV